MSNIENDYQSNVLDFVKRRPSLESGRQKLRAGDALGGLHDLERAARTDAHAHTFIGMLYEVGRPGILKISTKRNITIAWLSTV